MRFAGEKELARAAEKALSGATGALFEDLMQFVADRVVGAEVARTRAMEAQAARDRPSAGREVHVFLRECWDALDGLGRQVNICLQTLFPTSALLLPSEVTRRCTLYTVRRALRANEDAAAHPISRLLWSATREPSTEHYERLSFLYNMAMFVPVPLTEGGMLPGQTDLPEHLYGLIQPQELESVPLARGMEEMLAWVEQFIGQCYMAMAKVLMERTIEQSGQ